MTEGHTTLFVLLSGQVTLNEQTIEAPSLVVLSRNDIDFTVTATQNSKFLILTGQPLNEPDRKSTRLNSSHMSESRMPSSA